MTITLQPQGADEGITLVVTAAAPQVTPAIVVHRGLGGGTQAVWSGQPPERTQAVTHRAHLDDVPTILAMLAQPQRWDLIADDGCNGILAGTWVVTAAAARYDYDLGVAMVDITLAAT